MPLLDALRRLFGRGYQPTQPVRPELTPEEDVEPRERRLSVDEGKAADRGEAPEAEGHS
jgi:hypothetical protein